MSGASLAEIVSKIRVLNATIGSRLFIVDYLQIIDIPEKERRERELAYASQRFKGVAGELGVIIVILAQLNDEMHARNLPLRYPMVRDLRECKAVGHDANVIVLIDRPEQHFDDPDEAVFSDGVSAVGLARLHVPKIRRGKKRRVTVHFEGQYQRFGNWVPDSWRAEPKPSDVYRGYHPAVPDGVEAF
jgi:replicative DNA helicase